MGEGHTAPTKSVIVPAYALLRPYFGYKLALLERAIDKSHIAVLVKLGAAQLKLIRRLDNTAEGCAIVQESSRRWEIVWLQWPRCILPYPVPSLE